MSDKKNYFDKPSRKGKMMNTPTGQTGFDSGGALTKSGRIWKNDLMNVDLTDQKAIIRKIK